MLFMLLFWAVLTILLILFLINRKLKDKRIDSFMGFLVIIQFILFILAISMKDPFFEWLGIPTAWELAGEGIISGFAIWKYYLDPMKSRITKLEIHTGKLETKVTDIDDNVKWIRNNCTISFKK